MSGVFPVFKQAVDFAKSYAKLAACFCLAGLFAGCEKSEERFFENEYREETLSRAVFGSKLQLDPHFVTNLAESALVRDLFTGLMVFDRQGNIVPGVVRHSLSEDGKTWLLMLDEDLQWSNGEPVSADDFVASWQRLLEPKSKSPWANYLAGIKIENAHLILANEVPLSELGVQALSTNILQIKLEEPNFQLPKMLAHVALLPSYRGRKPEQNLITNGTYQLEHLDARKAILKARKDEIAFPAVRYHLLNPNQRAIAFDLVENPNTEAQDDIFHLPRLCVYFYEFNFNDPLVGQKNVRQAVRSMLTTTEISRGLGIPIHSILPKTMLETQDRLPFATSAESILAQMGVDYSNVLNITLSIGRDGLQHLVANRFIRQLGQSDLFRIRLQEMEKELLDEQHRQQAFQIMPRELCASYNSPLPFLNIFHSQNAENYSGYANENIDIWLDELQSATLTAEQWQERVIKIVQQINEDVAILPLFQYQRKIVRNPEIIGIDKNNDSGVVYSKDLSRKTKDKK